jgi:RNA polymerase sigma factor (sigma-70 family)
LVLAPCVDSDANCSAPRAVSKRSSVAIRRTKSSPRPWSYRSPIRSGRGASAAVRNRSSNRQLDRVAALAVDPLSPNPHELLERREIESLLARAIEKLPARERLVLALYYHEELTMKEVGGILGVNESRVSQIHSKAVSKLRLRLRRDLRPRASLAKSA